jgi:hypothetical protein
VTIADKDSDDDVKWTLKSGVPILKLIKSGIRTNNRIATKLNKAPSTISLHLNRLKGMGLIFKVTNEDIIKKMKFETENRTVKSLFIPYENTANGLAVIKVFDKHEGGEREKRTTEILISQRIEGLDDAIKNRISILLEAIISGIQECKDVTPQFLALNQLVSKLNSRLEYQWALINSTNELLDLILTGLSKSREKADGLRFAREYIIASRFRTNNTYDKSILLNEIKLIALENKEAPGLEALNALTELRDEDGTVSNELIDALLEIIWVANTPDFSSSITSADAEIGAIKIIIKDLSPAQKMIISRSAQYLDAPTSKEYVICVRGKKSPSISRTVNIERKQLLKRYLTIEFTKN